MQHLNVYLPDKTDFQSWIQEIKAEIIKELKDEMSSKKEIKPVYKTRAEIAREFRISLVTLHERTKEGLPSIKIGKRRLYESAAVQKYFAENHYK
jgi:hypothetical protein